MKEYVLSIIISAIISGIVSSFFDRNKSSGKIMHILTGILMTITVISPLKKITFSEFSNYFDNISATAGIYANEGKSINQENTAAIIKQSTEAYILDKAKNMGLDISVEVELNENNSVPCGIMISGDVAPYERDILCDYIYDTLGITRENQQWK